MQAVLQGLQLAWLVSIGSKLASTRLSYFGEVVREDPSTKVPSKVWTLQAFNEGPLPGRGRGGEALKVEGLRPSEVQTFEGTFKGTFKETFEGPHPSKVPSKVLLRRYL